MKNNLKNCNIVDSKNICACSALVLLTAGVSLLLLCFSPTVINDRPSVLEGEETCVLMHLGFSFFTSFVLFRFFASFFLSFCSCFPTWCRVQHVLAGVVGPSIKAVSE